MFERLRRLLPWVALVVLAVGFLNFLWFFSESSTIGDAQRGYISNGHYYLVHAGVATEVTKAAWDWSNAHAASLFLTHPLALAAAAYLVFTVGFPSLTGASAGKMRERVERIRTSGVPRASARTGGRFGDALITKPLVNVAVHPGGVVIKVIGAAPIGLETANLTAIVSDHSKLSGDTIRIHHHEPDAPADIRLYLDESSPVTLALRDLVADVPSLTLDSVRQTSDVPVVEPYPQIMKAMIIVGFGLSLVFAAVSLPFAGGLGGFGAAWSVALVLIIGYNAWRYFIRERHRW
jgi:hypothetical protein